MEAQTDIQDYLERGKQALAQGLGREAALAYAQAAQIEPYNPQVHLGLAEANLALGSYGVVYMACRKVQELQPEGGIESNLAQTLLDLLDRRYERALEDIKPVIEEDPANAYAHALHAYLLRLNGHDYDAGLERSRAARLSYGGRFENCFPPAEPLVAGYSGPAAPPYTGTADQTNGNAPKETVPTWSRPNGMRRQVIRTRFMLSRIPRLVTISLIVLNTAIYIVLAIRSQNVVNIDPNVLVLAGAQSSQNLALTDIWRIFTAMFLHFSIAHIGLNMLSLFFIGPAVEVMYGKWRYLLIYLISGIVGGLVTQYLVLPPALANPVPILAAGASGAIFGIFGALGIFYITNRQALGAYGRGAITNWLFWIGLNLVFGFSIPGIGIWDHIGGLIAGMILAFIMMPRLRRRRTPAP